MNSILELPVITVIEEYVIEGKEMQKWHSSEIRLSPGSDRCPASLHTNLIFLIWLDLEGKQSPTLKAILNKETICFLQLITVIQLSSTTITLCSSGNENSEQPHLNYVHHA
ncbi:uncharacterized protein LOC111895794 isoform X2 [Lactuca sativa]|uniref:uncharacterized protein LOC111895794 isoform X2 n=1 Tax=Lactuca sativa TaxID=4236 RepID=UPI0022AE9460|nr:uncharacterized protein LOC111895794 isoform X2 [Lactuca sativa]